MRPHTPLAAALALLVTLLATPPSRAHDEARLTPRAQALLADARRASAAFHDINAAFAAGYGPQPVIDLAGHACIEQPGVGAMGIHYVNGALFAAPLDERTPHALVYEPMPGGTLRLVGVEYIVFKDGWDAANPGRAPRLFDQAFHTVGAGNRYGLPPFYALHVWLWQPNPSGMFADWNPAVRCP